MKHRLSALASLPRGATVRGAPTPRLLGTCLRVSIQKPVTVPGRLQSRCFTITSHLRLEGPKFNDYNNSNARPASELNENITQEEKDHFAKKLDEDKGKQIRTPWHREGSDTPPVARQRSAGAMTKGKLLTTPSRMLKIILPLTTRDTNTDRKDIEPLALLVHPQQPISYLERLIQAELPTLKDKDGKERIPSVYFKAEDSMQGDSQPQEATETTVSKDSQSVARQEGQQDFEKVDEFRIDGKTEKTGKLSGSSKDRKTPEEAEALRGAPGKGGVESYSGQGQDAPSDMKAKRKFVRWSSSTEIGDFIRDAARGQEFAIEIEGAPEEIRVGVPSFDERTYYLRMRLRKTSRKISEMADVKKECDELAHKAAKNVAKAGFAGIVTWWGVVYYLTFQTELGWDVMEPVTYLVGLSTLIGGYVWFLYHNREVSYRSAMNFTISRRQQKLYQQHNFDLRKWEILIDDGNALRKEIKAVANEYDVEWDELREEKDEKVAEALKSERKKKKDGKKNEDKEDDEASGASGASEGKAKAASKGSD
ncbi:Nn.00g045790.m01.CDS01 [Neocucurbitaria sp. VM-36]